jgi:tRNA-specific 2-thiouridylase
MSGRVVVAMSGGVDSSVAAALLVQQGYEVIGITLDVWPKTPEQEDRPDACCSLAAVEDARRVADLLGIPHYTLNFQEVFAQTVIADFISEYRRGRTPNPCIRCNEHIKFGALIQYATGLGACHLATGHYARVNREHSRFVVRRGIDPSKDQTYVLYSLTQEQLAFTLFPLSANTKPQTRELARRIGLAVASRPDSQDICFVTQRGYGEFLYQRDPSLARSGPILDTSGHQVGEHRGLVFYTVGQRRGLGLTASKPLYVVDIQPITNALVVGPEDALWSDALIGENLNLVSVAHITSGQSVTAKVRYRSQEVAARVIPLPDNQVEVHFASPQRAITPGQAVVFYDGDLLLGGATIRHRKARNEGAQPGQSGVSHNQPVSQQFRAVG